MMEVAFVEKEGSMLSPVCCAVRNIKILSSATIDTRCTCIHLMCLVLETLMMCLGQTELHRNIMHWSMNIFRHYSTLTTCRPQLATEMLHQTVFLQFFHELVKVAGV